MVNSSQAFNAISGLSGAENEEARAHHPHGRSIASSQGYTGQQNGMGVAGGSHNGRGRGPPSMYENPYRNGSSYHPYHHQPSELPYYHGFNNRTQQYAPGYNPHQSESRAQSSPILNRLPAEIGRNSGEGSNFSVPSALTDPTFIDQPINDDVETGVSGVDQDGFRYDEEIDQKMPARKPSQVGILNVHDCSLHSY